MHDFGPYLGDSAIGYDAWRRRREWAASGSRGGALSGYAAYLNGMGAPLGPEVSGVIAAELSANDMRSTPESWVRPVVIGVVTSAAAFLVNRWLERTFFR